MENNKQRVYFVIDMKSFFASVECAERGLDPMTTDLVVADQTTPNMIQRISRIFERKPLISKEI